VSMLKAACSAWRCKRASTDPSKINRVSGIDHAADQGQGVQHVQAIEGALGKLCTSPSLSSTLHDLVCSFRCVNQVLYTWAKQMQIAWQPYHARVLRAEFMQEQSLC
jgi:hypothetical protein